jgi:DNA invertase Pin-like site-specific DNA recombinase
MALIGYARVSTPDQTTDPQLDALTAAGCDRIFKEKASGALRDRPELAAALDYLRPGDTLIVAKLDRLGRSLSHLIETLTGLDERGIGFRSLGEGIDTTTSAGRLMMHILGAIAQFERDLIVERTQAGLAAARARGRTGGRPVTVTPEKLAAAQTLIAAGHTTKAAAAAVGVARATLYRHLDQAAAGDE